MRILRSILAVVIGYMVFAVSAFAFFQLSGRPPHQEAPFSFVVVSVVYGMAFAALGGYLAAWLSGRRPLAHAVAVAAVLALGATASLLGTLGKGAVWSQVAALVFMAPCAVLGGWLRARRTAGA